MEKNDRLEPIALISCPKHPVQHDSPVAFVVRTSIEDPPNEEFDWNVVLDVLLFVSLFCSGAALLYFREQLGLGVFGGIFLNSGLTPIVLTSWTLMWGSTMFRRQNAIKAISAGIVFSTGYSLLRYDGMEQSLFELLAPSFLEIGLVFFISKMFFLAEDAELMVERLQTELDEAKRSPGVGMAMSYFYNFLLPTASSMSHRVLMSNEEYKLEGPVQLHVFIPRDLNENDIKKALRDMQNEGSCFQGKPLEKENASHRPMFVFCLEKDDEKRSCFGLFDVPTIISSCWDRSGHDEEKRGKIKREIIDFQNALKDLVQSNESTKNVVHLVSVPPLPLKPDALKHLIRKIHD